MIYDVIIIGAGASGLFCGSGFLAPLKGLILEKGKRPGRKLLMSGSGQCNITHTGSIKDFVGCYGGYPDATCMDHARAQKKHGALLRSCLYKYNNLSLMEFLGSGGVKVLEREDGKVFPASMDARDVLDLLLQKTAENGFEIRYGSVVERIETEASSADIDPLNHCSSPMPHHLWKVHTSACHYLTRTLVIATGGCSYPSTGSDGSMFHILARDLGIRVTPLKPALSSIQVLDYPYSELSGISFDPAGVSIWRDNRKIAENTGALLFTHQDLSGPAILNISKFAEAGDMLKINYLHPLRYEDALSRLKAISQGSKGSLASIIASEFRLPLRFCKALAKTCGESLKAWTSQLTDQKLTVSSVSGFERAMATSGGVALTQVDLSTMSLKDHPGIHVIGEALDVDGITGGYNLQFAYSSAMAAVSSICGK